MCASAHSFSRSLNVSHLKTENEEQRQRRNVALCCNKESHESFGHSGFRLVFVSLCLWLSISFHSVSAYSGHSTNTCWTIQYFTMSWANSLVFSPGTMPMTTTATTLRTNWREQGEVRLKTWTWTHVLHASCTKKIHWILTHTPHHRSKSIEQMDETSQRTTFE